MKDHTDEKMDLSPEEKRYYERVKAQLELNEELAKKKRQNTVNWLIIGSAILMVIVVLFIVHANNYNNAIRKKSSRVTKTQVAKHILNEEMLASIDKGYTVNADDISVNRFRSFVRRLSKTFKEDEQQIADMTVLAKKTLHEKGIDESMLTIMEGMNGIPSYSIVNKEYSEYLSAYIVLRDQGNSHYEAMLELK